VGINQNFKGKYSLHLQGRGVNQAIHQNDLRGKQNSCKILAWLFSTLKMEARSTSKTSFDLHRTTLRYNREDRNHHSYGCEKFYFEEGCLILFKVITEETDKGHENS
jgi:hypothetical protein